MATVSRRDFIKIGSIAGISISLGRLPLARAVEVHSGVQPTDWMAADGKARYRWDAIRKVTGQKVFARDYFAADIPGWPAQQSYGFFIKATRIDKIFEKVDLSGLAPELQPDQLIYHADMAADGLEAPAPADLGTDFYGRYLLVPQGETAPMYGHPVALLVYNDFERYEMAKRQLRFAEGVVQYGADAPASVPANYGAARYVRLGGPTPKDDDVFSAVKDAVIWGAFKDGKVVWPPADPDDKNPFLPASVQGKHRGGGGVRDPEQLVAETAHLMREGMDIAAAIEADIADAKNNPEKIVLNRQGYTQAIEPAAMETDNGNAWYDANTRTLHLLVATQSPYEVARVAAFMVKDNKKYPVEQIKILTGTTVGYGSKDHSIFPFYVIAACFYSQGLPLRLVNDRFEQFQMGIKRHAAKMDVTLVADRKSGQFEILKGLYDFNGGGRANYSFSVAQVGATAAQSNYYFPKSDLAGVATATPAVESGSMRGYGSLQTMSMTELMVDELAQQLNIDAIELRRKNVLQPQYPNTQGAVQMGDPRLKEMLDRAAKHPLWLNKEQKKRDYDAANPGHKYGVGFAQVQKDYGNGADSSALVLEFDAQGRLTMRHCVQEIGTGATTAQQVMVSDVLGKVPDDAQFGLTEFPELPLSSNYEPFTTSQADEDKFAQDPFWVPSFLPPMSASNSVYFVGFGTRQAAQFLLEYSIWPAAKALWSEGGAGGELASGFMTHADLRAVPGGIGGGGMAALSFETIAKKAHEMGLITGVAVHCFSRWQWATAQFDIPGFGVRTLPLDALALRYGDGAPESLKKRMTTGGYDFIKRSKVNFPPTQRSNAGVTTYTPAACLVELDVNTFTGDVKILSHHNLLDPGQVVVPELVSGQQQGGVAMGIGQALMEEFPLYEDGPGDGSWNFNRYTLPRGSDVAVWNQTVDYLPPLTETSPPKGLAEVVSLPVIAATGNAIAHAIGKRLYELPWTADKIKKALET